jgi:hypothetical protein
MNELCPAATALVPGSAAGYDHHCLYRDEFSAIKRLRARAYACWFIYRLACIPLFGIWEKQLAPAIEADSF